MLTNKLRVDAKAMHQRGANLEAIMHYLREQGASLIDTIAAVHSLLPEPSLAAARTIVLNSVAWGDQKEAFWQFQEMFWDAWDRADEDQEESAKLV